MMRTDDAKLEKRKPWYRLRNIILLLVGLFTLTITYMVYETIELANAEASPVHDYRAEYLADLFKETGIDPARAKEAWDVLIEAMATARAMQDEADLALADAYRENTMSNRFDHDGPFHFVNVSLRGPYVHPALDRERALIEQFRQAGVFEALDRFVELSPAIDQQPNVEPFYQQTTPHLSVGRDLVQVLLMDARLASERGNQRGLPRAVSHSLAMAHSFAHDPQVGRFVARAMEWWILREIAHEVDEFALTEETCNELLTAMDRYEIPPATLWVRGQHAVLNDIIQHHFTDDGGGDGLLIPGSIETLTRRDQDELTYVELFLARFFTGVSRRDVADEIARCVSAIQQELPKPPMNRWTGFDPYLVGLGASPKDELLHAFIPPFRNSLDRDVNGDTVREGTKVTIQLERFRARTGREPASLAEVEQELGVTLPVDPLHGGPFAYKRLDAPDEEGRMYLVYSTGFDRTDDGGVEATPDQFEHGRNSPLLDRTVTGVDFIINQPRWPWPEGLEGEE